MRFDLSLPLFWQGFMYGNIFLLGRFKVTDFMLCNLRFYEVFSAANPFFL